MDKSSLLKMQSINCSFEEFNNLISKDINKEARGLLFTNNNHNYKDKDKTQSINQSNQFNNTMLNLSNSYFDTKSSHYSNNNTFKRGKNANKVLSNQQPAVYKPNLIIASTSFSYMHIDKMGVNKNKEAFVPCKITNLDDVNNFLNLSLDSPLWYINNNEEDNQGLSYGPFSTKEVKSMYTEQKIDGLTRIRPVDIFKKKGKKKNGLIALSCINNVNFFIENYEVNEDISDLFYSFKAIKPINEPIVIKKEEQKNNSKEKKIIDVNSPMTKKEEEVNQQQREGIAQKITTIGKDILIEEKKKENIEKQLISNNQGLTRELHSKKKKGKGPRIKPTNVDVKVGFYTMSHQEKNYSPMYICGQSDQINNVPKNY